jgi:predicted glycosyltransferase
VAAQGNGRDPSTSGAGVRVMLYSHDGMGLGHVRRNLALSRALVERCPTATVLLAAGADDVGRLGVPAGVDVLNLPGLRKASDGTYAPRRLGMAPRELRDLRAALLEAAVEGFRPTVLVADKHPAGAEGELLGALRALRRQGGRALLGLRDILDDPLSVRREWSQLHLAALVEEYYSGVLVYGQADVWDPVEAYRLGAAVAARTTYCGYVIRPPRAHDPRTDALPLSSERPVVLATAGGGEDGLQLLSTFMAAADGAAWQGVAVLGPQAPEPDRKALESLAGPAGVRTHTFLGDLDAIFATVDAVVCMGGYNTVVEALVRGTPTVCVPRVRPRTEQLIRARRFAELGLLECLEPEFLSPDSLRRSIASALRRSREDTLAKVHSTLDFDGGRRATATFLQVADEADRAVEGAVL